jgi:hypothetical protein
LNECSFQFEEFFWLKLIQSTICVQRVTLKSFFQTKVFLCSSHKTAEHRNEAILYSKSFFHFFVVSVGCSCLDKTFFYEPAMIALWSLQHLLHYSTQCHVTMRGKFTKVFRRKQHVAGCIQQTTKVYLTCLIFFLF